MTKVFLPWSTGILRQWDLVSVAHEQIGGQRRISVEMSRGESTIKVDGADDIYLWNRLAQLATTIQLRNREFLPEEAGRP